MRHWLYRVLVVALIVGLSFGESAWAYTSKGKVTIGETAGSVTASDALTTALVVQGSATDAAAAALDFGAGAAGVRDSDESIKVTYDSNSASTRMIIYTDNKNNADPVKDSTVDASKGVDSGGLVGQLDTAQVVALLWAPTDANTNYAFDGAKINGTGAGASKTVSDKDHVATFTTVGSTLDNQAMVRCRDGVAVTNTANDGLYPQNFGAVGVNSDLCDAAATSTVVSQELSKNFAVIGFSLAGTKIQVVDWIDADGDTNTSEVLELTSPIYVPIGGDFTGKPAQDYKTNTLTVELVQQ